MKLISVVIVNYNGYHFLKRLLQTIANQNHKQFEIIFIDNASKDKSIEFIKKKFPEVKVYVIKNRGYGHACNYGAKKAKGKYIVFLNEDMYLPKDFLQKMLATYRELEKKQGIKIGSLSCKMVNFNSNPYLVSQTYGGYMDIFGFPLKNKDPGNIFINSGSPFFIERKLFLRVRGFNENIFIYGEDVDLSWRLTIFGYTNYVNHDTYIYHYGGGVTGVFGSKKIADNLLSSLIPIITNYSFFTLLIIFPFYLIYIFFISMALFLVKKFDFCYNKEIITRYLIFIKKIRSIIRFRNFVQRHRKINDYYVIKNFVILIPAFIVNLSFKKLVPGYFQGN